MCVKKEHLDHEDARLLSYFTTVLENATKKLGKKQKKLKENELLLLNQRIGEDTKNELTEKIDMLVSTDDISQQVEQSFFIEEALSLLTSQQQRVVTETVLKDRKEQDVAKEMGISQPAIHHIKNRALEKLRKHY